MTSTSYRLDPLDRGFVGPLTRRQVVVLGAGLVLWMLFSLVLDAVVAGCVVMAVTALVSVPPFAGQPIINWLPVWCGWMFRGRWARRWVRPLHLVTGGPLSKGPSLPPWLGGLRIIAHPDEQWAAIHDTSGKTITAHLQVAGSGFTCLSPDQMDFLLSGWGQVFGAVAADDGLVRVTWSDVARGVPLVGHDEWAAGLRASDGNLAAYRRFVATQQPLRHDLIVTISIQVTSLRHAEVQVEAMERLRAAVTIVTDALSDAKLAVHGPLTSGEVAYLMRLGLDPTGVEPPGGMRPGSLVHTLGHVPVGAAGPMYVNCSLNDVRIDASTHRTLWVESWPERRQAADWFDPILACDLDETIEQRVFTLVIEPISEIKAVNELRHAAARHGGDHQAAAEGRSRFDAFKRRKADAVDEREHELADGHVPVAYVGLVTITTAQPDGLDRATRALKRRCARHRVFLRELWGRMDVGYAAGLPIGLGLSREPF